MVTPALNPIIDPHRHVIEWFVTPAKAGIYPGDQPAIRRAGTASRLRGNDVFLRVTAVSCHGPSR